MKHTEYIAVRDHGKQGLHIYSLTDAATRSRIACWSPFASYDNASPGFRPGIDVAYCYEEASMGYYQRGTLVRFGSLRWVELRATELVEQYRQFSQQACDPGEELELVVRQKDSEEFRKKRWKR